MPITPRNYSPVPYAGGPSYVPNYGTLGELMGMRARNSQVGWAQLANVFNNFVETRNQAQVAKAALAQRQAEHEAEQQLKRDEMNARAAERAEADRIRKEAEKDKQQLQGEKRGDARAKAIGYGPVGEADVDTLMQSPERSGDVRYSFGPGTAQGPELQPTRDQQEMIDLRTKVEEILENKKERIILIKADEDARYSAVMDCMDELRASGIEDMGLITDPKTRGLLGGGN
jgi:hypothetical protein